MRRELKIILVTLAVGGAWAIGGRVPGMLDEVEAFHVSDVQVAGARYLTDDDVRDLMELDSEANIWSDASIWADRLERHTLVESARVRRRLPGTLLVDIRERRPVALVSTPTLEPVDADGVLLPIDPSVVRLDLPIIEAGRDVASGARLVPGATRELIREVVRLMDGDTAFLQMVSEVAWADDRTLVARWSDPAVDFLLQPGTSSHRIREGILSLDHAVAQDPRNHPDVVDLRFADQVVIRRKE